MVGRKASRRPSASVNKPLMRVRRPPRPLAPAGAQRAIEMLGGEGGRSSAWAWRATPVVPGGTSSNAEVSSRGRAGSAAVRAAGSRRPAGIPGPAAFAACLPSAQLPSLEWRPCRRRFTCGCQCQLTLKRRIPPRSRRRDILRCVFRRGAVTRRPLVHGHDEHAGASAAPRYQSFPSGDDGVVS